MNAKDGRAMDTETVESSFDGTLNSSSNSSTIREFLTLTSPPLYPTSTRTASEVRDLLTNNKSTTNPPHIPPLADPSFEFADYPRSVEKVDSADLNKITRYLQLNGFTVGPLDLPSDLQQSLRSLSNVTNWIEEVLLALIDQSQRMQKLQQYVLSTTENSLQNNSVVDIRLQSVENQLQQSKKREMVLQQKIVEYESSLNISNVSSALMSDIVPTQKIDRSKFSAPTSDPASIQQQIRSLQLKAKSLESLLQESERKSKQREMEFDRLRQKLTEFVERERHDALRHSKILKKLEGKEKALVSLFSSAGFSSGPLSDGSASASIEGNRSDKMHDISQLFLALEKQRRQLKSRNEELELQIQTMSKNSLSQQKHMDRNIGEDARVISVGFDQKEENPGKERIEKLQKAIEELQEMNIHQKVDLDFQGKKLRLFALEKDEDEKRFRSLQQQNHVLQQTCENLRLELKSRPTIKQWNQAQREIADLEQILHNTVAARKEAEELTSWKKYLSTNEQIKIDQRNHDLHLWLVESLPKSYLKDIMQLVCRELDVTDVSEVVHSIQKLKTVVRTVPRMEELLSNISSYVFERNAQLNEILRHSSALGSEKELSLDSILSILRRWWMIIQRCIELEDFRLSVLYEMFRRNDIIRSSSSSSSLNALSKNEEMIRNKWKDSSGLKIWIQKESGDLIGELRDVIDFEVNLITSSASSKDFQEYVRQRPDIVSNRIISHLQSLFEIGSVDDLIPSLNQLYLRHQEFLQFLEISKNLLGKPKTVMDSTLLSEILQRLQHQK